MSYPLSEIEQLRREVAAYTRTAGWLEHQTNKLHRRALDLHERAKRVAADSSSDDKVAAAVVETTRAILIKQGEATTLQGSARWAAVKLRQWIGA